jgi:hypothetical protein
LIELEFRGFAYEGAGMALALLDRLTPWNRGRLRAFLDGPGDRHAYMVHVGAGWALARHGRRVDRTLAELDPLLGWLVVDGYGFHEGYFHSDRFIDRQEPPQRLDGYARRVFDQGLGRCIWFVDGADTVRIPERIGRFEPSRRADLWSGVGLACAYAGGADREGVESLAIASGPYRPCVAQGAAFAAKARQRAGNPSDQTELACRVLCGVPAQRAAEWTDVALVDLTDSEAEPRFEIWRRRIQERCALEPIGASIVRSPGRAVSAVAERALG